MGDKVQIHYNKELQSDRIFIIYIQITPMASLGANISWKEWNLDIYKHLKGFFKEENGRTELSDRLLEMNWNDWAIYRDFLVVWVKENPTF